MLTVIDQGASERSGFNSAASELAKAVRYR